LNAEKDHLLKERQAKIAKKARSDTLVTLVDLTKGKFRDLRKWDFYAMENNCEDDNFWRTD
jgi:hypothetical protein